jgi:7-cyano-7-deazaguanine synthase
MTDALLLSGGLDSVALAAMLRPPIAISCNYGQVSAEGELRAAKQVATELGIDHHVIDVDCRSLGSGDLAGKSASPLAPESEWWPFRNQLLVTLAAMLAIRLGASRLLLGTVKSDSFHVDGTEPFIKAIDCVCRLQEGNIRVVAPAIGMTSAELIRASGAEWSLLAWAHSCHTAAWACGQCRGCCKHRLVMQELGYESY